MTSGPVGGTAPGKRWTAFGYLYAVGLLAIAVYGYFATGYVPVPTPAAEVFATVRPAPGSAGAAAFSGSRAFEHTTVGLYRTVDFAAPVPPSQLLGRASLFDVEAVASFTNTASGESFVTEGYYDGGADGNAIYRFRFTPTSLGTWSLLTTSAVPALDGLSGTVDAVPSEDPHLYGFLTTAAGRFVAPVAGTGEQVGIAYQVFMHGGSPLEDLGSLPTGDEELRSALADLLDEAASYGFPAIFVGVWHQWFELGTSRSDRHFSVDPDPATFRVLEILCNMAHQRGMFVHIWLWGDEQRSWSPRGIPADADVPGDSGGVNGAADRRLQRYLAARLGPLPNWVLGYGFDLYEWADEAEVLAWAEYLQARLARPHLLTAIEQRSSSRTVFDLGSATLGLVSDAATAEAALESGGEVSAALYAAAVAALEAAGGKPVIFENRFLFQRRDVWTMDATRRALWAVTLAGGVAAIWGVDWDLQLPFSHPEQLLTYQEFWSGRLRGDMVSSVREDGSLSLIDGANGHGVIYAQATDVISLPALPPGVTAWAVDTRASYQRLPIEATLDGPEPGSWRAPHVSDWAVALEAAPR